MHHLFNARSCTGPRQFLRQREMGFVEVRLRAMQDGDQINHRILTRHRLRQGRFVVHTQLQHGHGGQRLQVAGVGAAACGHSHMPALAHQFFAHMGTDKARTAEN